MINKLWTDVSLENYNNWYPLTGKITETPQQYIKTWPIVNDWFKTFAIRAQNDINAYLDFILSKFPFDSFKDKLIKETLRDMVYVMVEHWVFNRTPIEFNVDATIQFNNGNQFSASSIPTINVWDLAPSRMKIWARLTELKQVFLSYNQDEIDIDKIDLQAFYTRNQVDELIKEQKKFTLSKQMKLYDDLVDDNENEIYRGRVTNFINKGYVATDYDPKTETMILDWPDEIGTLPPEALQNNPQIGDYTHAPTCDFSAKQQKRITTNENNITKLNDELTKTNENIDDIKNNWFNIETSPLWKKMGSFISSNEFGKTYLAIWGYIYQPPSTPTNNYIYNNKKTIFNLGGEIQRTTQKTIKLDELIVNDNVKIQLLFTKEENDITVVSNDINYQSSSISLYQYIGKGKPTEFIAEDNTQHDYYTKQETNDLLDKKQNIDDNNLQTTVKQIVPAINEINNKIPDLTDYYTKPEVDKKLEDKVDIDKFSYAFTVNALGTENPNLETTDKTVVGAINEINAKSGSGENWKKVGTISDDKQKITYQFKQNTFYRVGYSAGSDLRTAFASVKYITFKYISINNSENLILDSLIDKSGADITNWIDLVINRNGYIYLDKHNWNVGFLYDLEEGKTEETYEIRSNTLEIKNSNNIDITKPLNVKSNTLNIKEIAENTFDIELKENPPTPCPCPKWKEVGIREKNKWGNWQITYDFIPNKKYLIYYSWNIYNPVYTVKAFVITDNKIAGIRLETFNDLENIQILSVNHAKYITIYCLKGKNIGNLWKLEELQE